MEEEPHELYGIEDEFEEQFADELEALAELEGEPPRAASHKVSEFRSRKRTFEEALSAGDLVKDSTAVGCGPGLGKGSQGPVLTEAEPEAVDRATLNSEEPECLSTLTEAAEDPPQLLIQKNDTAQTPKAKRRRRLEAVKKLDFGIEEDATFEASPQVDRKTLSPRASSAPQDSRTPRLKGAGDVGVSGMLPLHVTPPEERDSKKVLRRPPVLEDYINVTSTNGTRVFMVVKEDGMAMQPSNSLHWNKSRPLHLLGVPFSYLKEQVAEERQRQILESSQQLMEVLNSCLGEEDTQIEAAAPSEEEESNGQAEENGSALHCLWVDQFTPRHYVELLSDDYTNRCLLKWLKLWDMVVFGKEKPAKKAQPSSEAHPPSRYPKEQQSKWKTKAQLTEEMLEAELDQHNRPKYKVALLCGPPGLGKTTLAHVIVKHAGYNAVEMNASDDRSPDLFKTRIEAATQMKSVLGANEKPNCLVIDEIDGAPTASINVLLSIINRKAVEAESESGTGKAGGTKRRKEGSLLLRPIICICNDQYVPSLRLLRHQAFMLNFPSTSPSRLVQRLHEITVRQGMKADTGALMALCEKTENDIRSCINTLQFLYSRGKKELNMRTVQTAKVGLKDQNKGLFSIWQEIFQLPKMQRQRIGMDPSIPAHLLAREGDDLFGVAAGRTSINAAAQRFHHILHLTTSSGEHEKLTQGLYDNFLNMKVKDPSFGSICLALEWLGFSDLLSRTIMHGQNFQLMRYLPFLPVSFHLLFAASNVPRLAYPSSQHEALTKLTQMQNLVASMISGVTPISRSRTGPQSLVLEVLCLLLEIISPKLRPVNTQLYSQKEKQQLAELIATMLAYNLTYHQERTPDGQYVYKLDPNMEEVCRFPDLPARKPLTYQAKQLIAREIEVEKMRRTEAMLHARNSRQALEACSSPKEGDPEASTKVLLPKSRIQNHEQRLDQIVKRATCDEKPETDFFGRVIIKKTASPSEANKVPEKNVIEKLIGKAVGQSDVWFRFNEGVSNAVRRNIYIKDLF
ncbi:chromosome transmission fidelity protein 18 homolog [Elgaria multicarinata webbii]|uniref:chromosome transmission fidelity protein 18 homolog n=1 Tax=Elgaria multicarinata webbii TaxID=159646 RepID=UPI002FCCC5A7